ncbi:hypothetical protein [Lysobacter xanthus]
MILDYMLDRGPVLLLVLSAAAVVAAALALGWLRLRRGPRRPR